MAQLKGGSRMLTICNDKHDLVERSWHISRVGSTGGERGRPGPGPVGVRNDLRITQIVGGFYSEIASRNEKQLW